MIDVLRFSEIQWELFQFTFLEQKNASEVIQLGWI